jgi:hypothetical protein
VIQLNTPAAVADFLERYNVWRREGFDDGDEGEPIEQPAPSDIGAALDAAVAMLRAQANTIDRQARTITEGINERNRLHVELARRDGIYQQQPPAQVERRA